MAYRFKLKESLQDGVRRIAVEQISKALAAPHKGADRVAWVHETRKALKRTRSLLRCVRSGLGDQVFGEENAALADIARQLSDLRDRDVLVGTINGLKGRCEKVDASLAWLAAELAASPPDGPSGGKAALRPAPAIRQAVKSLEKAQARLAGLEVTGELVEVVGAGLRDNQRVGRQMLVSLATDGSDENLHELRKAVQTYQRQQILILAAWPELQNVCIETARVTAQMLGEAQDLAVLAATAEAHQEVASADAAKHGERIVAACRERQGIIREVAIPMSARLFALRPKAVEQQLRTNWEAAGTLTRAGSRKRGAPQPPPS
jgi:CHAD domain-containing protein